MTFYRPVPAMVRALHGYGRADFVADLAGMDASGLHAFAVAYEKLQRDRVEIFPPRCNRSR